MTADLRTMCGLGYPPSMNNQNANECGNSVIKRDIKLEKLGRTRLFNTPPKYFTTPVL